jgi:c-di-GMP-binding flagellar brake protein YcgR
MADSEPIPSIHQPVPTDAGDADRRHVARVAVELPCKIWSPRTLRFVPGTTRDLSQDGTSVVLRTGVPFRPGERIRVGLPQQAGPIVLRSDDLIEGTVLRSIAEDGRLTVTVRFDRPEAATASS